MLALRHHLLHIKPKQLHYGTNTKFVTHIYWLKCGIRRGRLGHSSWSDNCDRRSWWTIAILRRSWRECGLCTVLGRYLRRLFLLTGFVRGGGHRLLLAGQKLLLGICEVARFCLLPAAHKLRPNTNWKIQDFWWKELQKTLKSGW